jgi:hypothetical protein
VICISRDYYMGYFGNAKVKTELPAAIETIWRPLIV